MMRPSWRLPESLVTGAVWVPLYRDQKTVNIVASVVAAVPVPCGELATAVHVPPLGLAIVMAWFDVSRKSNRMSSTAMFAGSAGVIAFALVATAPALTNVGTGAADWMAPDWGAEGGDRMGGRTGGAERDLGMGDGAERHAGERAREQQGARDPAPPAP